MELYHYPKKLISQWFKLFFDSYNDAEMLLNDGILSRLRIKIEFLKPKA
jgi:hypothetical protein